jgi:hypothetical protein
LIFGQSVGISGERSAEKRADEVSASVLIVARKR